MANAERWECPANEGGTTSTALTRLIQSRGRVIDVETRSFMSCLSDDHGRHGFAPGPPTTQRMRLADVRVEPGASAELVGELDGALLIIPLFMRRSVPEDGVVFTLVTAVCGGGRYLQLGFTYSEEDGVLLCDDMVEEADRAQPTSSARRLHPYDHTRSSQ